MNFRIVLLVGMCLGLFTGKALCQESNSDPSILEAIITDATHKNVSVGIVLDKNASLCAKMHNANQNGQVISENSLRNLGYITREGQGRVEVFPLVMSEAQKRVLQMQFSQWGGGDFRSTLGGYTALLNAWINQRVTQSKGFGLSLGGRTTLLVGPMSLLQNVSSADIANAIGTLGGKGAWLMPYFDHLTNSTQSDQRFFQMIAYADTTKMEARQVCAEAGK